MKKFIAVLLVAGCATQNTLAVTTKPSQPTRAELALVQAGIAGAMRDPSSVQFSDMRAYSVSNGTRIVCGAVNAKNAFGGYVGFDPFYVRLRGQEVLIVQTGAEASQSCAMAGSGAMTVKP